MLSQHFLKHKEKLQINEINTTLKSTKKCIYLSRHLREPGLRPFSLQRGLLTRVNTVSEKMYGHGGKT